MEKSKISFYINMIEPYKINDMCHCPAEYLSDKFILKTTTHTVMNYDNIILMEATIHLGCKTCGGHDDITS